MLTYVDGGLLLVSGQDPDVDGGLQQGGDGLRHSVLQAVLDGRRSQQTEVLRV